MIKIVADLHIHSCLSPCGSLDNSPLNIINEAVKKGIDMVALTDHNSCENLPAFFELAKINNIVAIAGMEITTEEEAHLLAFFPTLETALDFSKTVYKALADIPLDYKRFGDQVIVDKDENIIGEKEKFLGTALPFSVDKLVDMIHKVKGLAIAAHIDRSSYSLIGNLGFLPDLEFDGVESYQIPCPFEYYNLPLISNSDAHYIDDIGKRVNHMELISADFKGLKEWFSQHSGKKSD